MVAIDYLSFEPIAGVDIIEMDFTDPAAEDLLKSRLRGGRADVVLSDMAAPTIGHAKTDHIRIMGLAETAAAFAADVLEPGGVFLCKVFQGGTERDLLAALEARLHDRAPCEAAGKPIGKFRALCFGNRISGRQVVERHHLKGCHIALAARLPKDRPPRTRWLPALLLVCRLPGVPRCCSRASNSPCRLEEIFSLQSRRAG